MDATARPEIRVESDSRKTFTAIFQGDECDLPVEIRPFQLDDPPVVGVGTYFFDHSGQRIRGTVLRWDNGLDADPTVIQWRAPHCENDECGSPCEHREAS